IARQTKSRCGGTGFGGMDWKPFQRWVLTLARSASLEVMPTIVSTTSPALKSSSVGMARTPNFEEMASLSSTLTLAIEAWPPSSAATCSRMGAMALQGPHQGAQKSTRTGWSPDTVESKFVESRLAMLADMVV